MNVALPSNKPRMGRPPGPPKKLIGVKLSPEVVKLIRENPTANSKIVEDAVLSWLSRSSQTPPETSSIRPETALQHSGDIQHQPAPQTRQESARTTANGGISPEL